MDVESTVVQPTEDEMELERLQNELAEFDRRLLGGEGGRAGGIPLRDSTHMIGKKRPASVCWRPPIELRASARALHRLGWVTSATNSGTGGAGVGCALDATLTRRRRRALAAHTDAVKWSVAEVGLWLGKAGYANLVPKFETNAIDGKTLLTYAQ